MGHSERRQAIRQHTRLAPDANEYVGTSAPHTCVEQACGRGTKKMKMKKKTMTMKTKKERCEDACNKTMEVNYKYTCSVCSWW